jgi:membrane-bound ClpP family serine protease
MTTPTEQQALPPTAEQKGAARPRGSMIGGIILIALGLLFLAESFIPGFSFWDYWPLLLVVLGVLLLVRSRSTYHTRVIP